MERVCECVETHVPKWKAGSERGCELGVKRARAFFYLKKKKKKFPSGKKKNRKSAARLSEFSDFYKINRF